MRAIENFLRLIWPDAGVKAIVSIHNGKPSHYWFTSDQIPAAAVKAKELSDRHFDVYMSMGGFDAEERKGEHAIAFRCLFLDLDCGEGKDYPDQDTAHTALETFVAKVGLPMPMVVSSGYGLHCYWPLDTDVEKPEWLQLANALKHLCEVHGFATDVKCTADAARILRPNATFNYKNGTPRRVEVLEAPGKFPLEGIRSPLTEQAGNIFETLARQQAEAADPNRTQFTTDYPEAEFEAILPQCATLRWAYENQPQVQEPLWYAVLGLAQHLRNGREVSHRLSRNHPEYDPAATDRKRDHWATAVGGPPTCDGFRKTNGNRCSGCTAAVATPLALGRPRGARAVLSAIVNNTLHFEDKHLRLTDNGLQISVSIKGKEEREWIRLASYGIRPLLNISLLDKDSKPAHHVWMEAYDKDRSRRQFIVPAASVNQSPSFSQECAKYGVFNEQELFPSAFRSFTEIMRNWIRKLEEQQNGVVTFDSFGWMGTDSSNVKDTFLLGNKLYTDEGVREAPILPHLKAYQDAMVPQGSLEEWTAAMDHYNRPGMEAYMFTTWAAWGAPLMGFTSSRNIVVSLVGDTGVGKSSMQRAIASVYGDYNSNILVDQHDSTLNAVNAAMGCLNSLPYIREEAAEADAEMVASWVLTMTQGRERGRLTSALANAPIRTWSTIAVISSNTSIHEIVVNTRKDNAARLARTWELDMRLPMSQEEAMQLFRPLRTNFGLAGPIYIEYIVKHRSEVMQAVRECEDALVKRYGSGGAARFYLSYIAACLVGAHIAIQLGLIHHDIERGKRFALQQYRRLTKAAADEKQTPEQVLAAFIQESRPNLLVVECDNPNAANAPTMFDSHNNIIHSPTANATIEARFATDSGMLYVSTPALRKWYVDNHLNYRLSMDALKSGGILKDEDRKIVMTRGTRMADKKQVRCVHFDLSKSTELLDVAVATSKGAGND